MIFIRKPYQLSNLTIYFIKKSTPLEFELFFELSMSDLSFSMLVFERTSQTEQQQPQRRRQRRLRRRQQQRKQQQQ